ncbi:PLC-like phosphodiesterase [Phaeosphaeria sp. MPI-PUGE-AT-0046c]|nr:PLC-like phosphodiesterase [Phaeosphaeria sp. MPI-PUGE-AT-0046c]
MSLSIAVRNLTSASISIKRIEQFEDRQIQQSRPSGLFYSTRNTTSPVALAARLRDHDISLQCLDLDIVLAPFESCNLGQAESAKDGHDDLSRVDIALRLTIEDAQGTHHHIEAYPSYTQKFSSTSKSLSTPSSTSYTALFHPTKPTAHLAIHTNHLHDYQAWMSRIPDSTPLSVISIPGTHNSHTHYRALPSVRCQAVDIKMQLEHGIRFLDIRLQPANATSTAKKDLYLVHGAFPISLTGPKYFAPVLQTCYDFLAAHPSETILLSLKKEGIGASTDEHLALILAEHYFAPAAASWHLGTTIPSMGAVRGKLVLVRRYRSPEPLGLDATSWPSSPAHALFPEDPMFCLQDYCDVMDPSRIKTKVQYANEHLVRAARCQYVEGDISGPLYLNYLSASNFWNKACWPEKIAGIVNRGMEEWLCVGHGLEEAPAREGDPGHVDDDSHGGSGQGKVRRKAKGDGGTGVVVMDLVGADRDWDLVNLIVGMNLGLWVQNT